MFTIPTYVVLDLPTDVASKVIELRSRFDAYQAKLPPEITIAGSSGVGVIHEHQNPNDLFDAVERVAREHLPISTAFVSMERFPGVPIFWLKPRDRAPFDSLHQSLIAAGIQFQANPFPFNPHCTISATVPLSSEQEHELFRVQIPPQEFVLSKLSIYQLSEGTASLLQAFPISSARPNPSLNSDPIAAR